MKKTIAILLSVLLMCGAVSCGEAEPKEPSETEGKPAETLQQDENDGTSADTEAAPAESATEQTEAAETDAPKTQTGYVCLFDDGTAIEIGAAADAVVASLGTPLNVAEAPSCIHEGMDRIYSYNGFSLTTSPDAAGADRVHEIALTSDAVVLDGGISIGSPLEAVAAVFGNDYTEQFGVLQYIVGNAKISVVLDEDSCVSSMAITANS